jgi:hypothetical protein
MPPLSRSRPQQYPLPFGPVDHFDALHGLHNASVAVCAKTERVGWIQRMYRHDEARGVLPDLSDCSDWDLYLSQNGFHVFKGVTRQARHVQVITSCWVDLDYYKVPALRDLEPGHVAERILQAHPWLPEPSLVVDSGRGAYVHWLFDERVHTAPKQVSRWQFAMDMLAQLLKPFGADAQAVDLSRVLRVIGSTNTKSGEPVALVSNVVGRRVKFGKFTDLVIDNTAHLRKPKQAQVILFPEPVRRPSEAIQKRSKFSLGGNILHLERLDDYRRLIELRGGKLTDCRKRMSYWVACSLAWICRSREQAEREMAGFIAEYFAAPDEYTTKAVSNVLALMDQAEAGVTKLWQGQGVDPRHRARATTIIRSLEISAAEQASLTHLAAPELRQERKRERRREKRRQAGMVPKAEYTARVSAGASQRATEARSLRDQGLCNREIATRLGVSERSVRTYFKA